MKLINGSRSGFILPTVLVLSLTIVTIMVALLMVTSSAFGGNYEDHYQKLADEAAEAGSAYATACLNLSEHTQTWGAAMARPDLRPNTNCNGTNSYPTNLYVYSNSTVRTYFVVGNLDYSAQFSAQVSARGYSEVLTSSGTVEKTYTSMQKKIITWPTDISGQMSASGTNRTCAIVSSQVYCWGFNRYGQLGNGQYVGTQTSSAQSTDSPSQACPCDVDNASSVDSQIPVKVTQTPGVMEGKKIKKIFVAQYHSCALSDDGFMYCWGYNTNGQLGRGNTTDSSVPVRVMGALASLTVTDIGGTNNGTCAIAGGKIYCWGANSEGLTGRGVTSGSTTAPTLVSNTNLPASYVATALSTSGSRSRTMCAIVAGKAYCWGGDNAFGAIGDGSTDDRTIPTKVDDTGVLSGKTVTAISQDGYPSESSGGLPHVCAVADGKAYCWGKNNYGQIGDNTSGGGNDRLAPIAVDTSTVLNGKTVQDVQVGLRHSCARADGGAYCWGMGNSGQVGNNASGVINKQPVAVWTQAGALTSTNVISIGAGANRSCAVISDGRTFCWGLNDNGQIGDGTKINRNIPTESLFLRPLSNQYIF